MKVYVRTDAQNRVIAVDSSAFLADAAAWTQIDEGDNSDKYRLAQTCYFPAPILEERGVWRYKLVDGVAVERTQEERDADASVPQGPTAEARLSAAEATLQTHDAEIDTILAGLEALGNG